MHRIHENPLLEDGIVGTAQGVARDESFGTKGTGRPGLLALFGLHSNQNRRNSNHLERALHRDRGAMTQPSAAGQQHGVGSNSVHFSRQGGDGVLAQLSQRLAEAH